MNIVLLILISYFLGAIPVGFLIGKIITARLKHQDRLKHEGYLKRMVKSYANGWDVRKFKSGNPGATNVFRVFSRAFRKKYPKTAGLPGVVTFIIQASMSLCLVLFLAPHFANGINVTLCQVIAGAVCVIGNTFTVFFPSNFKGGKAIATATGVFIALTPLPLVFAFMVWLVVVRLWGFVSFGSIIAPFALLLSYLGYLWMNDLPVFSIENSPKTIFIIALAGFILFTHRKNIKNLLNGTENSFKSKKTR